MISATNKYFRKIRLSLKSKLILGLVLIGFVTSIGINFSLILLGSSNISETMRQSPILEWQYQNVASKLRELIEKEENNRENSSGKAYLESLVGTHTHQTYQGSDPYAAIEIKAFAYVDNNSILVFKTANAPITKGDVGAQIPIASRDDLADALLERNNSGIERLYGDNYLVIRGVKNTENKVVGATMSWQSWKIKENQTPLFYLSTKQAILMALGSTIASFYWILPSMVILGWLTARIITRRFQHLYNTIEDWGNGKLDSRIKTKGHDEIAVSFQRLNLMAEKLALHQKELKHLISIEERQRLAAELHDTVKQQLFASNLFLGSANQQIESSPIEAQKSLQLAIEQNSAAFKQVNDLILTLSPMPIGGDLRKALKDALNEWRSNNQQKLDYKIDIEQNFESISLTEIQQQVIFRSIMEALQNIRKHSTASEVTVELTKVKSNICWSVIDNGSMNENENYELGQGLSLMKKRLESFGGVLEIVINKGFNLSATLPLKPS